MKIRTDDHSTQEIWKKQKRDINKVRQKLYKIWKPKVRSLKRLMPDVWQNEIKNQINKSRQMNG